MVKKGSINLDDYDSLRKILVLRGQDVGGRLPLKVLVWGKQGSLTVRVLLKAILLVGLALLLRLLGRDLAILVVELEVAFAALPLGVVWSHPCVLALGRLLQAAALVVALAAQVAGVDLSDLLASLAAQQACAVQNMVGVLRGKDVAVRVLRLGEGILAKHCGRSCWVADA